MKAFRVLVRGENFLMKSDGTLNRFGFYTTRLVEGPNDEQAKLAVVELIRQDDALQKCVLNKRSDPPMLFAEEIYEISKSEFDENGPIAGYSFYEQKSETD